MASSMINLESIALPLGNLEPRLEHLQDRVLVGEVVKWKHTWGNWAGLAVLGAVQGAGGTDCDKHSSMSMPIIVM